MTGKELCKFWFPQKRNREKEKVKVKVAQSCPTLCDPVDRNLPGSSVHGILQARILEWVAIPFSRGSSQPRDWTQVFCIAGRFFTPEIPGKPREKEYPVYLLFFKSYVILLLLNKIFTALFWFIIAFSVIFFQHMGS